MLRVIDLSHKLESNMQIYPGDPVFTCTLSATVEKDGYNVHSVSLGSHTGSLPLLREIRLYRYNTAIQEPMSMRHTISSKMVRK